jgi:hypothetical protein
LVCVVRDRYLSNYGRLLVFCKTLTVQIHLLLRVLFLKVRRPSERVCTHRGVCPKTLRACSYPSRSVSEDPQSVFVPIKECVRRPSEGVRTHRGVCPKTLRGCSYPSRSMSEDPLRVFVPIEECVRRPSEGVRTHRGVCPKTR